MNSFCLIVEVKTVIMTTLLILFTVCLTAVSAFPSQKIVGGTLTTIEEYPSGALILMSFAGSNFVHVCGGSVINNRSILTAAHCLFWPYIEVYRIRVGSSYAHSGGDVHSIQGFTNHQHFNPRTLDNDIGIVRIDTTFNIRPTVKPASIAGANYNLPDDTSVWAIGWGAIFADGPTSEQLRHVNVLTVNQAICKSNYATLGHVVTDNMLCSGWLNVGGKDQCQGDSGSPLFHNNVIVGICSWGESCALPKFPGVNVRVSKYTAWIQSHA